MFAVKVTTFITYFSTHTALKKRSVTQISALGLFTFYPPVPVCNFNVLYVFHVLCLTVKHCHYVHKFGDYIIIRLIAMHYEGVTCSLSTLSLNPGLTNVVQIFFLFYSFSQFYECSHEALIIWLSSNVFYECSYLSPLLPLLHCI